VPVAHLEAGTWEPASVLTSAVRPFGALVTDGVVVSEVVLGASVAAELIGPGDVVDVRAEEGADVVVVHRWSTAGPVTIAVLDAHLLPALRAWPSVAAGLTARAATRARRLEVQRAISQLPRVEERLLAFFGHLAERYGRVSTSGVVVPLALTHQMLGRLVGARRPTVSLALKELAASGALSRRGDGAWLLAHGALAGLTTDAGAAPPARPSDAALTPDPQVPVRVDPWLAPTDIQELVARCHALGLHTHELHRRTSANLRRAAETRGGVRLGRSLRTLGESPPDG